jgi:polar amino acid transport system permease protein
MSTATSAPGAGHRPPVAYDQEVPPGSIYLLIASWLLAGAGAVMLLFAPILVFSSENDIAPAKIAMFAFSGGALLGAAVVLFTHVGWAWLVSLGITVAVGLWIGASGGLTDQFEPSAAAAVGIVAVVLLVLGRRTSGRPEAMALTSAHVPFRVKVTIVWFSIFFVLGVTFALMQFDVAWMKENFAFIAKGLLFTVLLAFFAIILAVTLALFGALGRLSRNPVAYGLSGFYTSFFRGTPLIVQLFLIYLALPQIGSNMDSRALLSFLTLTSFQAGLIGLGLNYGAYMTEIFRAGIQSVGHGQAEAADALGMRYGQRMRRVVLPQALRVIVPPTGNEFIAMMKDTALVSVLGSEIETAELFRRATIVGPPAHRSLEALILAAGLYWALTAVFTLFQSRLERRLSTGYVRAEVRQVTGQRRFQFLPGGGGSGAGSAVAGVIDEGSDDPTGGPG